MQIFTRPLFPIWDGSSFHVSYMAKLCETIPLVLAITTLLKITSVLSIKNPQKLNCALVALFTKIPPSSTYTDEIETLPKDFSALTYLRGVPATFCYNELCCPQSMNTPITMSVALYVRSQRASLTLSGKAQRVSRHTGVFWTGTKLIEFWPLTCLFIIIKHSL